MGTNITNFVGIDVSKLKIDVAIIKNNDKSSITNSIFENNIKGMQKLSKFLQKENKLDMAATLICIEHTGIYNRCLLNYISKKNCLIWVEMPVKIIKSMGLQRGKSDKLDAQKIALYAYKNHEDAELWQPKSEVLQQIQDLLSLRDRLIQARNSFEVPIKELKSIGDKKSSSLLYKSCKTSLSAIEKDLEDINKQLAELINQDENLKKLHEITTSVTGIGNITSLALMCYTNAYQNYKEGKQLACYCGVAPFEHSSGTSVRGKTRVNHMANKDLKRLLHLGALAAVRSKGEFKDYYSRKLAEGKNKMSVINAIRNKMLLRVAAVVRRGTPYEKNFVFAR